MAPYERILVPTDGSDNANEAATYALDMAKMLGAEVMALSVNDNSGFAIMSGEVDPEVEEHYRGMGRDATAHVVELGKNVGVEVSPLVIEGIPAAEIVTVSKEFDVVVMGTMGRTGLAHFLLGSVAEHVVRLAHCPVLVVRAGNERKASECHRLLVATDGSESSKVAVEHGLKLAASLKAEVTAMSVSDVRDLPGSVYKFRDHLRRSTEACQRTVDAVAAEGRKRGLDVATMVAIGSPANEIVKESERHDLVVTGTLGRSGLARLRLGSVAERTVRHSRCPVLVVRGSDTSQ